MYATFPRLGHVCMHAGPLQAMYTSATPQKSEKKAVKHSQGVLVLKIRIP
jgi:hypothetical protein